jgi:glutamine synthetase
MTTAPRPVDAPSDDERITRLERAGAHTLRGTFIDSAGVIRAKQTPIAHAAVFCDEGLGAAPAISAFTADDAIAPTPGISAVGDYRLRLDLAAAVDLGDGIAWGPTDLVDQEGRPVPACPRSALRRQCEAAAALGVSVMTAIEVEFVLFDRSTGEPVPSQAYGISSLDVHEALVDDLMAGFERVGLDVAQLHGEYGRGQFEVSFAPADPLSTADRNLLARIVISNVARAHGCDASFSPKPLAGEVGTGAHHHLSFRRDDAPLLSGGSGPHGLTADGESIIAGLVANLPSIVGALSPSAPSALRRAPHSWSGAFACWGLENREAAVRLCEATHANHHGAHVEVKVVDPSANVYVAGAVLIGAALDGLAHPRSLPPEITVDPGTLSDEERAELGVVPLAGDLGDTLDTLEASSLAEAVLGRSLLEPLVSVRRHEVDLLAELGPEALIERLRYVWTA